MNLMVEHINKTSLQTKHPSISGKLQVAWIFFVIKQTVKLFLFTKFLVPWRQLEDGESVAVPSVES